jgi:aminoglycoside phosphotransferase
MTDAGLALLTGDGVRALLTSALPDPADEVLSWRLRQVDHRPGNRTTVAYDVVVAGSAGRTQQRFCASSTDDGAAPAVWRFPFDPSLPALATAVDEDAVRALLTSRGVAAGPMRLDVRSYRPRRRAVVEVRAASCRLFLKVLRPHAAAALDERHRLLHAAGLPVPRSLGRTEHGLLVLEGLAGSTLRARLREGGSAPDAAALLGLLDRLPEQVHALPARRSWADSVAHYAGVTAAALPAEAARCGELAASVQHLAGDGPADAPTHGDFYEAQLLVDGSRLCGLLDVDTVGPGRRADDLACLLAHGSVLAQFEPAHAESILRWVQRWQEGFERRVDPVELRARVAGVVVSLATGPHRVQQAGWQAATSARLDLAERWLASADRVRRVPA